ncbi:MAG: DEAD/DEAH box helicase family protein, partial [Breznakibacter sp.]|nr:DEAD/DEAH box helicase family protein [Breznakibacter sp.]
VDRIDLEEQLKDTAALTGERVNSVVGKTRVPKASKNEKALVQLDDNTPDLNLVMIHKFGINQDVNQDILYKLGVVPKFEAFDTINPSEKVLILIDEAHRSQNGDMSKNLFVAFPQATRFGFTGTPLITERHKFTTAERFCQPAGEFIDTYKMNNAVADRATVDVKYIGKSTYDEIKDKEVFDLEYEETFKERTEEERQEILKRYGGMIEFLESQQRVQKISTDILNHYVADILTNGFKAMVVTASVTAAVRYKYEIEQLIPSYIAAEESKTDEERDDELLARLRILKVRAVVSMQSNNEPAYITKARKEGSGDEVVKAFKKSFNTADPTKTDTGIAILCVCDRLLTGFDAPIAQVLYMDKNLREHDLLQAIARVNRTKKGKTHGIVVDYFGITKNLAKALGIYTDKEAEENREELLEFGEYFKDINKEIPELELRYQKIVQLFEANQIDKITDFLHQKITASKEEFEVVEAIIELAATLKFRSELDLLVRNYFDRLDLLFNVPEVQAHHWIPAKRLGYLLWRIRYHYKDDTLDLKWASAKVRKLIDKHLIHIGIVTRVAEVSMLSDDFPKKIDSLYRGSKSRASAMEHAVRHQIKVKLENNDPALYVRFKDKLEYIINQYQGNWDLMIKELEDLQSEINQGRKADYRFKSVQLPFYDYLKLNIAEEVTEELDAKVASITKLICSYIKEGIEIANFWEKMDEVKKVKDKIASRLRLSGINSFREKNGEISSQLMLMAKNNFVELIRHIHEMAE